ncbi:hypothetical protein A2331_04315 [Candidatus Falkowbacteria bacterium RIFOXYB2_FULL_34_18]|uniref:Peptidase C39-like domain-containing protein n=1 Tax=Candidatus Falkowbacteria bacterium RIFOXYD2_FULL_34_120 TaxID=1798007 RepID=A0A1F5TPK1_9BACT|nr:MAG: hypothetical protein A2500_04555 [Candidatus Falkowbacteria bacterium RIFOXYC12_FULL_34_55]OGF28891.1 MAG: hypothetical protein A2331_04315 [Candidatus Falkowbacteria bacterium RIFOXYB2_FULL_34_18]OGF35657.1 MAG: hypothetical protein A2466_04670 [Candidatus Falkowbacteria bacterium RIFOXYC2_FULL_34_220]OGF38403.1 MAG: hypothetical protein A2515_02975 [Candidatus Falkowbacteria bacterium RIFOXYD12_FULL_34_57]OGF40451.1 MAG: hypothetical protein A2531_02860 [Candidatus Falkowbacteria bact
MTPCFVFGAVSFNDYNSDYNSKKLEVPHLIQKKRGCAPTSLAMIMKYYGVDPGNYHKMFYSDTFGHSPLAIKYKAGENGFVVRLVNQGSFSEIKQLIDNGIPIIAFGISENFDWRRVKEYIRGDICGHVLVVSGYFSHLSRGTRITNLNINDPGDKKADIINLKEFEENFWNNSVFYGYKNYYIAIAPGGSLQAKALNEIFPYNRSSVVFSFSLYIVYFLEKTFYSLEKFFDFFKIHGVYNLTICLIIIFGLFIALCSLILIIFYRFIFFLKKIY